MSAPQKSAVAAGRASRTGVVGTGTMVKPTTAGLARVTGPTNTQDPGADASARAGSGEATCDAAVNDASWGRTSDGIGVRVGDRDTATVSLRETDCQLCGLGAVGGIQWGPASAGTHQQARQLAVALPAGGSGASHGAERSGVAQ